MFSFLVLAVFAALFTSNSATKVYYAIINPIDKEYSPQSEMAVSLAVEKLNNDSSLFGAEIELVRIPILSSNSETENLRTIAEFAMDNQDISGVVGMYESDTIKFVSVLGGILRVPMIGGGYARDTQYSDKDQYPYLARVISSVLDSGYSLGDLIDLINWKRVTYVGASDGYSEGAYPALEHVLEAFDVQYINPHYHDGLETHTAGALVLQMDAIIQQLFDEGAKVIVYSGHPDEQRLWFWRAMKLGLLGSENVQFLVTHCSDEVTKECPIEECAEDASRIEELMQGTICVLNNFEVDEEWFENVWKPATTLDKLTPEQISVSGTDDWVNGYDKWATLAYDATLVLAKVQKLFCEVSTDCFNDTLSHSECESINTFETMDSCYQNLTTNGPGVVTQIKKIKLQGVTGSVVMGWKNDRDMSQIFKQWVGDKYEHSGIWRGLNIRGDHQACEFDVPLKYSTGTGEPPITVFERGSTSFLEILSYFIIGFGIFVCVTICILLKKNRSSKLERGKTFLTDGIILKTGIVCTIALIVSVLRSLTLVSPDQVFLSVILEYFYTFPILPVLSGLGSRMYRLYKVTNNRKMRVVRFSRYHSIYVLVAIVLIALPSLFFRMYFNNSHIDDDDGEGLFERTYNLQDENLMFVFRVTRPIYDLFNNYKLASAVVILFGPVYTMVLGLGVCFLSKMAASDQIKKTNKQLAHEMVVVERAMMWFSLAMFVEVVFCAFEQVFSSKEQLTTHIGFENEDSIATLDGVRFLALIHVLVAFASWASFIFIFYSIRVRYFENDSSTTTAMTATVGGSAERTDKGNVSVVSHDANQLSDDMLARLRITNINFGSTFSGKDQTADDETGSVKSTTIADSRGISGGKSADVGSQIGTVQSNGFVSFDQKGVSASINSRIISSGQRGGLIMSFGSQQGGGKLVLSQNQDRDRSRSSANDSSSFEVTTLKMKNRAPAAVSYNSIPAPPQAPTQKLQVVNFIQEMRKLSQEELVKQVEKFEVELKNCMASVGRMYVQLLELDEKLDKDVLKLEILMVKSNRLKGKFKGKYALSLTSSASKTPVGNHNACI